MPYTQLILDDVPELSGETALQLIDVLYALAGALEVSPSLMRQTSPITVSPFACRGAYSLGSRLRILPMISWAQACTNLGTL